MKTNDINKKEDGKGMEIILFILATALFCIILIQRILYKTFKASLFTRFVFLILTVAVFLSPFLFVS